MPNLFNKLFSKKETPFLVELQAPEFSGIEKEVIGRFINGRIYEKAKRYLIVRLLNNVLHSEVSEDFKKGWLECLRAMKELPVTEPVSEDGDKDQSESMWTGEE